MIVTITPNPAIDLTWRVSRLAPGTTHRMPTGTSRAGGKGLNVARVLLQTGHEALALTTAGGATGDELASLVSCLVADRIPVVVDTSGPGILAAARAGAYALRPNQDELAEATSIADPVQGARFLPGLGARLVLTSLGAEGLLVVAEAGAAVGARLPRTLSGNSTGAGDAAVAVIAATLAGGGDLWSDSPAAEAARAELTHRATARSAGAVLMPFAGEISADHVALADEVRITTIDEERR